MSRCKSYHKFARSLLIGFLVLVPLANAQGPKPLVQIQRLRAELESDSNSMSIGRNAYDAGMNGSQQMNLRQYPNSATCLVVYEDGKYFFEKREEHTPGKPKAKSAEGVLGPDDLQHLKGILEDEELKKISTPKALNIPADAQVLQEAERLEVRISRANAVQQFSLLKEQVKTGATITGSSSGG